MNGRYGSFSKLSQPKSDAGVKSPKILIVEDEQIVAADLERTLQRLGFIVTGLSQSAQDAITEAGRTAPDLVLMDIKLKGHTDGVEAAEVISWLYNIPVIYLTAFSNDQKFRQITRSNKFGYLTKPFQEDQLKSAIDRALKIKQ
jgi:CheY-like chemotaxis protein